MIRFAIAFILSAISLCSQGQTVTDYAQAPQLYCPAAGRWLPQGMCQAATQQQYIQPQYQQPYQQQLQLPPCNGQWIRVNATQFQCQPHQQPQVPVGCVVINSQLMCPQGQQQYIQPQYQQGYPVAGQVLNNVQYRGQVPCSLADRAASGGIGALLAGAVGHVVGSHRGDSNRYREQAALVGGAIGATVMCDSNIVRD